MDQGDMFCPSHQVGYARMIAANGATHVVQACVKCHHMTSREAVSKDRVRSEGVEIATLPIIQDYRGEGPECEVKGCTSTNTELHHWAPRQIFGPEAERWPSSYLCREQHHPQWHVLVTSTG